MSIASIRVILDNYRLRSWLVVSCRSNIHRERLFQLFVFYVNEESVEKFIVLSQKNKFSQFCTDNDEFVWRPKTKSEFTFSFKNYVVNLPNIDALAKHFQALIGSGHKLSIMSPDEIKSYSTKPTMAFWDGYRYFIHKASKAWGINKRIAAFLVSREKEMSLLTEDEFFERCDLIMQQQLHLLLEIERNLKKYFEGDDAKKRDWLNTLNENFNNLSAIDFIISDPAGVVIVHQNSTWLTS